MKNKQVWFKVLSKNKEGCLIKFPGVGNRRLPWKEVEENFDFDPDNSHKLFMKEHVVKRQEEGFQHLHQAQVFFLLGNNPKNPNSVVHDMAFLEEIQKAAQVLKVTEGEALVLFKSLMMKTTNGFLKEGVGIGGRLENSLSGEKHKKNEKNKKRLAKEHSKKEFKKETDDGETYHPFACLKERINKAETK